METTPPFAARLNHLPQDGWAIKGQFQPLLGVVVGGGNSGSVRFQADCVHARIRAASGGHPFQFRDQIVHFFVVDYFSATRPRHFQSLGNTINRNHTLCPE